MNSSSRHIYVHPILWMALVLVVAYWQVAFLQAGMHWDMLDVHLPWLTYMSDVFAKGELHYWNPYQAFGYPFHADLLSTWYPPSLLVAATTGFDLAILHLFFLVHLLFAGINMRNLLVHFKLPSHIAMIGATCYMVSGMTVSNAQHLFIIISITWIPAVIHYFLRLIEKPSFIRAIALAVAVSLMILGGYPFMTVVTLYLILTIFLIKLYKQRSLRNNFS